MNYQRIYEEFIEDRRKRADSGDVKKRKDRDRHHIKPRSLGGGDEPENLISLTLGDHLFAHLLLAKIHGGKLAHAFIFMCGRERYAGRSSRINYAAMMAKRNEHLRQQPGHNKGKPMHPNSRTALEILYEKKRLGLVQPSPKVLAALAKSREARYGRPAWNRGLTPCAGFRAGIEKSAEARRGKPAYNRGVKAHPNQLAALQSGWGRKHTPEAIEKGAAKRRGQKRSPESRARMVAAAQLRELKKRESVQA